MIRRVIVRVLVAAMAGLGVAPVDEASGTLRAQERQAAPEAAWEGVVAEYRALLEAEGIVGSSLALVVDGEVRRREDFGMADLEAGRAVEDGTLYHWASITKTFTAVAIMQLRDRGLLALDDPVVDYVPELRTVHDPFGPIEEVTLRHLLSHSAGFRSSTWPWDGGEPWQPWEPTEWSQLVAMLPYTDVEFEPGSRFQYSNPGIVFLGRVIEAVTGDVFESYVEKNILRPLGMRTAYFDATPWHLSHLRSRNYSVVEGRPVPNGDFNTGVTVSNGGLNASVVDMARWVGFLTGAPTWDGADAGRGGGGAGSAGVEVLARPSLEEMWAEVVPVGEMELGHEGMGLAFWLYPERGLVGHTGSQRSFFSFILFDPRAGVGAIAAFNTAGGDGTGPDTRAILNAVRLRVADELLAPAAAGGRPVRRR